MIMGYFKNISRIAKVSKESVSEHYLSPFKCQPITYFKQLANSMPADCKQFSQSLHKVCTQINCLNLVMSMSIPFIINVEMSVTESKLDFLDLCSKLDFVHFAVTRILYTGVVNCVVNLYSKFFGAFMWVLEGVPHRICFFI